MEHIKNKSTQLSTCIINKEILEDTYIGLEYLLTQDTSSMGTSEEFAINMIPTLQRIILSKINEL